MRLWRAIFALALLIAAPALAAADPPWNNATNCSGTIASGGAAQALALPVPLHGYQIENLSTDTLAFSEFTTTPATFTNGSWTLGPATATQPGQSYNSPGSYSPARPIYIIGATTGDRFTCGAW